MSGSSSYLGAYLTDNPARNNAGSMSAFKSNYDAFTSLIGARPRFYDTYTDNGQGAAGLPASAEWEAKSFAQTGDAYVGPSSGTTPVVGVPLSDSSAQWGSVDTFYQAIISGSLDADYKGIVDAWANNGYKTVEFRLGYEFTGGFMPWSPEDSSNPNANADFVRAFQHLADIMHSEASADGTTAKIVWCPAIRQGTSYDIRTLYPGDQYVDVISTDLYSGGAPNGLTDWAAGGTTQDSDPATWASKPGNYEHYWQYQELLARQSHAWIRPERMVHPEHDRLRQAAQQAARDRRGRGRLLGHARVPDLARHRDRGRASRGRGDRSCEHL